MLNVVVLTQTLLQPNGLRIEIVRSGVAPLQSLKKNYIVRNVRLRHYYGINTYLDEDLEPMLYIFTAIAYECS